MSDGAPLFTEEPENPLPELTLDSLPERLRDAAGNAGWPSLMPVQARGIPYLLAGRDMIVQARTGSGKTGAFLLPMLERLDPNQPKPQALVLVPTRELASQVGQEALTLCAPAGFKSVVIYGGVGYREQIDALKGGAQIVIGTPGRVLDHLLKRTLSLDSLKMLIFDEADRMLSMGFYPDMKRVQRYLPQRHLQACMFSATFPSYVLRTAREFIPHPGFLSLSQSQVAATSVEHYFYEVQGMDKDRTLVRVIELENPQSAIIFCNTKARVHYISTVLQRFGYDADELSADLSQKDRERVLDRIRKGTLRFLVATDVAARGIDLPELSHVIQYEPPEDPEAYVHRAGRTGRAGASGIAISLVVGIEKLNLNRIATRFKIDLQERPVPQDEDVQDVVSQRVTALLEARLRERDPLHTERSKRFLPLGRSLAENEDESAIIAMLLDDYYQQSLHAPLVQPPENPTPPARPVRPPKPAPAPAEAASPSREPIPPREPTPAREPTPPREPTPAQKEAIARNAARAARAAKRPKAAAAVETPATVTPAPEASAPAASAPATVEAPVEAPAALPLESVMPVAPVEPVASVSPEAPAAPEPSPAPPADEAPPAPKPAAGGFRWRRPLG